MDQLLKIYQLTVEDAAKIANSPNDPHVHEFDELIIGVEGQLEHFIDFKATIYNAPYISFVTQGKLHRVKPLVADGKCLIWVVRFNPGFIPESSFHLYSLYHEQATLELTRDNGFNRMVLLCEMMHGEMQQDKPNLSIVRDLLRTLFTMIGAEREKYADDLQIASSSQNTTFRNFLKILEENYHRPEGVEFYAGKLFMTSRNLNLICQKIMNKSVSEIIEARKMMEGKNQLIHTPKSVSEIGYDLGYSDKACFTTVFKKNTGQTPTAFRDEMHKLFS